MRLNLGLNGRLKIIVTGVGVACLQIARGCLRIALNGLSLARHHGVLVVASACFPRQTRRARSA